MQLVLVYLQWFWRNSWLKCVLQPKIAKKIHWKPSFLGFKVVQGHWCWYQWNARRQCLLWYAASLSVCNHSRARLVDSSRNRTFSMGYPNFMHSYGGLLETRGQTLHRWNLRLMRTFHMQVVLVYLEWFWCNSCLKCVLQPKIAKKNSLKTPILGV